MPLPQLHPLETGGLVAFWDFQERAGQDRVDSTPNRFHLREKLGPIETGDPGPFGPRSLRLRRGQWLQLPRAELGPLNIFGATPVSLVAWLRQDGTNLWQFIGGVWNERDHRRQYALFLNGSWKAECRGLTRTPANNQAHGYISSTGGHTPGHIACFSYATGATTLTPGQWHTVGFTWDGHDLRVYLDGQLDTLADHNPFPYPAQIFDGGPAGADFTVGQRNRFQWASYPDGDAPGGEGFDGLLGGLAVYNRALTAPEMATLHRVPKP